MMYAMKLLFIAAFAFLSAGAQAQVVFQSSNFDRAVSALNDRSEVRPWVIEKKMFDLAQKEDCLLFFDELQTKVLVLIPTSQYYVNFRFMCMPDSNPTRVDSLLVFEALDNRYVADAEGIAKVINNTNIMSYKPQAKKAQDIFTVISQKTLLTEVGSSSRLINEYQGQMRHHSIADFRTLTLKQTEAAKAQKPLEIAQWISNAIGRDVSESLMTTYFPLGNLLDIVLNANYLFDDGTHMPVQSIFATRSRRNCATSDTGRCDGTLP